MTGARMQECLFHGSVGCMELIGAQPVLVWWEQEGLWGHS